MNNKKHISEKRYWNNIHQKYEISDIKIDDWLDLFSYIIDFPIVDSRGKKLCVPDDMDRRNWTKDG